MIIPFIIKIIRIGKTMRTVSNTKVKMMTVTVLRAVIIYHKSAVAAEAALVVVSSASTERMFSLLSAQIHDNQSCALADYQTNSVILRYNKNQLARKYSASIYESFF